MSVSTTKRPFIAIGISIDKIVIISYLYNHINPDMYSINIAVAYMFGLEYWMAKLSNRIFSDGLLTVQFIQIFSETFHQDISWRFRKIFYRDHGFSKIFR